LTQERAEITLRALQEGRTAEGSCRPWERLRGNVQPGEPGDGKRTSLGSRTLQHRAIPEERPSDLPRSAATSGGCGGLCPPAAWDTTALDVRHAPALCPCWSSACHSPGSHPPASVWLLRTSTRAHGGGRTPPLGGSPGGGAPPSGAGRGGEATRIARPGTRRVRPAVPRTGATAGAASRVLAVPGQAWRAALVRRQAVVRASQEPPGTARRPAGAWPRPARAGECAW
jgi:hypothetical protein